MTKNDFVPRKTPSFFGWGHTRALHAGAALLCVTSLAFGCSDDDDNGDPGTGGSGGTASGGSAGAKTGGAGGTGGTSTNGPGGLGGLGGDDQGGGSQLPVNAPADLATESASSYDDNEFGVISGTTLDRWLADWPANRPRGITGRLIILQQDSKAGVTKFIKHDDEHVFTYGFAEYAYADSQKRNNGLLDTFATIPDGEETDTILNEFDIDLTRDLVVFAFVDEDAVPGAAVDAGAKATKVWYNTRSWWWLRYWGADARHLAILNGAAEEVLDAASIVTDPSPLPAAPGTFSVKELRVDNTSLKIDVGELRTLVHDEGDVVLVDPRRKQEYFGEAFASPANPVNGKRPVFEGRIKGARFLPWQATLEGVTIGGAPDYAANGVEDAVTTHALKFKPKAALVALYNDDDYVDYDGAAEGAVTIHYCGHGRRASTWAFISLGVLGIPARLYDGSWVEWGNLAGGEAGEGEAERPLPENSPWRTDLAELTVHGPFETPTPGAFYNDASATVGEQVLEASAAGLDINPNATHTDAIIRADQAYKED